MVALFASVALMNVAMVGASTAGTLIASELGGEGVSGLPNAASVIGTALGLILGYGLSWLGGHYQFIRLDAAVYSLDYLPFAPRVWDGVIVAAVSLGVSLIATPYPSGSAAKVLPAEALRYE